MSPSDLIAELAATPDQPLRIVFGDHAFSGAFHITEIKIADIRSVDCGKGTDAWQEVIVQLLDDFGCGKLMTTTKFVGILQNMVADTSPSADMIFEAGPGGIPLSRYRPAQLTLVDGIATLTAVPMRGECKVVTRAMAAGGVRSSCC